MKFKKAIERLRSMPLPKNGSISVTARLHGGSRDEYVNLCRICMRPRVDHQYGVVADCLSLLMLRNQELENIWAREAGATKDVFAYGQKAMADRKKAVEEGWQKKAEAV